MPLQSKFFLIEFRRIVIGNAIYYLLIRTSTNGPWEISIGNAIVRKEQTRSFLNNAVA